MKKKKAVQVEAAEFLEQEAARYDDSDASTKRMARRMLKVAAELRKLAAGGAR